MRRKSVRGSGSLTKSKVWFLIPSAAGVALFVLIPFADVMVRSLCTAVTGEFCGIENYRNLFSNRAFLLAVRNTARFVGVSIPLLVLLSLFLSLALNRSSWCRQLKSMFLFPLAVPTAAVVLIWQLFFSRGGIFNRGLMGLGIPSVDWLGSGMSFWVLVISYLWKNIGYTVVIWLAGMKNIPLQLLEAARTDGAGEVQCLRYIVLPQLKPVFYTIVILSFLNSFKVFREAYLVAGAYPEERMYLLQHLFNNWFMNLDVDKMAAAAVVIAVVFVCFVLALGKLLGEHGASGSSGRGREVAGQ